MKARLCFQVAAITFALIFANSAPSYCQSPQNSPAAASQLEIVKDQVQRLGLGEDVSVKLFTGVEYYGAISKIELNRFEIAEVDLKEIIAISYTNVMKVEKGYGPMNSSTGKREKVVEKDLQKGVMRSFWIIMLVGVASTVAFAVWATSKFKKRAREAAGPFPRIP